MSESSRVGAHRPCLAFVYPKSAHGALVELCETWPPQVAMPVGSPTVALPCPADTWPEG